MAKERYTVETRPPCFAVSGAIVTAMRLALKYQHRTPTWRELVAEHGMSRATAYRWVNAFKVAKGEA